MIGVQPSIAGELPIASSSAPAECCLPSLLASFHEKYPEVRIRASVSDSQSVMRAVEKGLAVLGLAGGATESSGLKSEVIGGDTLVLILAPKHRFVGRRSISLSELAREPLILREQGSGTRCTLQRALQTAGMPIDEMNIAFEVGSLGAIKVAVGRGLGVSFVSRSTVIRELAAGELASVPVSGLDLTRSIYVIRHARRPLSPAAAAFLHFLKANPPGLDRR